MKAFDLHCDTIPIIRRNGWDLVNDKCHVSIDKFAPFEHYVQCFAIAVNDRDRGQVAIDSYETKLAYWKQQAEKYSDRIFWAKSGKELETSDKPITAILTVENACSLGGKFERVEKFKKDGVAMMGLTWNSTNEVGSGINENKGLSDFGKEVVKEIERLGMLIDTSHLSDAGFEDVVALAKGPIVASHSNARAVCGQIRNVTDEQFKEIVRRGGFVGLNYFIKFICDEPEKANFDDIYKHIEHFLSLGGEKSVALGSDFDGAALPECLSGPDKNADFYEYLLKRGLSESLVQDIFYNNAMNVFKKYVL